MAKAKIDFCIKELTVEGLDRRQDYLAVLPPAQCCEDEMVSGQDK